MRANNEFLYDTVSLSYLCISFKAMQACVLKLWRQSPVLDSKMYREENNHSLSMVLVNLTDLFVSQ